MVNGPNNRIEVMKEFVSSIESAGTPILGCVWNAMPSGRSLKPPRYRDYYRRLSRELLRRMNSGDEALSSAVESYSNGFAKSKVPSIS